MCEHIHDRYSVPPRGLRELREVRVDRSGPRLECVRSVRSVRGARGAQAHKVRYRSNTSRLSGPCRPAALPTATEPRRASAEKRPTHARRRSALGGTSEAASQCCRTWKGGGAVLRSRWRIPGDVRRWQTADLSTVAPPRAALTLTLADDGLGERVPVLWELRAYRQIVSAFRGPRKAKTRRV